MIFFPCNQLYVIAHRLWLGNWLHGDVPAACFPTSALFWLMLAWYIFFCPLIFNLLMLYIKWISFGSYFFVQTNHLFIVIWVFLIIYAQFNDFYMVRFKSNALKIIFFIHFICLLNIWRINSVTFTSLQMWKLLHWNLIIWNLITCLHFYLILCVINALRAEKCLICLSCTVDIISTS